MKAFKDEFWRENNCRRAVGNHTPSDTYVCFKRMMMATKDFFGSSPSTTRDDMACFPLEPLKNM